MDTIATIGLDIEKSSFSVHGCDAAGRTAAKRVLKRAQVLGFLAQLPPCTVALEACASAHHWAREIAKLGHEVKLVPAARVKRFVERQKNDAADAKAIAAALAHPETRFVAVKTVVSIRGRRRGSGPRLARRFLTAAARSAGDWSSASAATPAADCSASSRPSRS